MATFTNKSYHNEEHVRFALVGQILQKLGWDIWDPKQVYTEFNATKNEDNTKVDVALFSGNYSNDSVFIECKAVGKVNDDLQKVEKQLRDYNRNNTALFTIITDGRHWRFYFSFAGGEFYQKLFKVINIEDDSVEDIELQFQSFLNKDSIFNGNARTLAQNYLNLSQKEKAMKDALPEAEKLIALPPFLSLPDALVSLLNNKGLPLTREEAIDFLKNGSIKIQSIAISNVTSYAKDLSSSYENTVWTLRLTSGILAKGILNGSTMRVKKDSTASSSTSSSITTKATALRKDLIKKGILIQRGSELIFTQDHDFESPAQAAVVICGYSVSAPMYWRTSDNIMMKDALVTAK